MTEVARQASMDERLAELSRRMLDLHISRIGEMPRVELYLEQVLSTVSAELSLISLPNETTITGPMVNSYVKRRIVPAPTNRRYTRRHLATLLFVCSFKRVFSIAQVEALLNSMWSAGIDMAGAYDGLVDAFEHALADLFSGGGGGAAAAHAEVSLGGGAALDQLLSAAILALANKVYAEQTLAIIGDSADPDEGSPRVYSTVP